MSDHDDAWVRTGTLLWKLEHVERVQVRPGIKRRHGIPILHEKSKRPLERRGYPYLLKSQFQLTSKCRGEKPTIQVLKGVLNSAFVITSIYPIHLEPITSVHIILIRVIAKR